MPTTRRSTRAAGGAGKQSTLSFKHKVTKAIKTGKEGYKSPARAKEYLPSVSPEPTSPTPTKKPEPEIPSPAAETIPLLTTDKKENDLALRGQAQAQAQAAPAPSDKSEAEARAEKITDKAIERYWAGIESSRSARAVHRKHTEDLTTGEKVLRYFDVSSQYGPCIGISRIKRWQRAERLGLNPPIEVLAVLLKEEAKGTKGIERAHMDILLSSTAVGSVGV